MRIVTSRRNKFSFALGTDNGGTWDLLSLWTQNVVEIDNYGYLNMKTWSVRI